MLIVFFKVNARFLIEGNNRSSIKKIIIPAKLKKLSMTVSASKYQVRVSFLISLISDLSSFRVFEIRV